MSLYLTSIYHKKIHLSIPSLCKTKKNTQLDIDQTDVVFADGGVSYSIKSDDSIESKNISDGKNAINILIQQASSIDLSSNKVKKAMFRSVIGYIDFVWGTPGDGAKLKHGYGLSHIIKKRNRENGSGIKTAYKLIEVIAKATDVEKQTSANNPDNVRLKLHYDGYTALLQKSNADSSWLLSGWEDAKKR